MPSVAKDSVPKAHKGVKIGRSGGRVEYWQIACNLPRETQKISSLTSILYDLEGRKPSASQRRRLFPSLNECLSLYQHALIHQDALRLEHGEQFSAYFNAFDLMRRAMVEYNELARDRIY